MNKKEETLFDKYLEDEEFARFMAQEDLIIEITEGFCKILEEKHLSRSKLARLMGRTRGYISQLLNGRSNITLRSLADIAYHLGYHVIISFEKKVPQSEQISLELDWDIDRKKSLPDKCFRMADDYFYFGEEGRKLSKLGA